MASNFWIGASVSVTANSKLVTVLSSSDDITKIKEGAAFVASNYSIPFEVNRTYNDGSNDIIELKENWSGATSSSVSATVVVGPGAIASTREAIVNLISAYEAFEALVSPTVIANGLAQRTATGQLKTANAVNNDEAVAKGQFNSLTQSYLNTFGLGQYTEQPSWPNSHIDNCNGVASGVYKTNGSITAPDQTAIVYFSRRNVGQLQQILISGYDASNTNTFQWRNSNGGTDSAPTWGEWKTVYHSGNSVNPLDYGIGAEFGAAWPNGTDLNNTTGVRPGIYKIYAASPTEALGFPANYSANANVTIIFNIEASTRMTMILSDAKTGETYVRAYNGSWQSYRKLYDSTNSVNPLHFGLGGAKALPSGTSLLSISVNGIYYVPSATNAPSAQTANWVVLVNATDNPAYRTIKAWGVGTVGGGIYGEYTNTLENSVWGGWRTVFDSGNSKNPLEYGMAGSSELVSNAPNNNLSEVIETQIVRADNANDKPASRADNVSPGMSFYLNRFANATSHRGSEICFGHFNSAIPKGGLWHRSLSGTYGAGTWLEIYDSGNTNFDEFGGIDGDDIAVGWTRGTTTAYVHLPLSSPVDTPATGINVTGSFEVRDFTNNTLLGTVSASDFSFVRPSNKLILVLVQNLTGLTGQQPIILRTASSDAKIKVTF